MTLNERLWRVRRRHDHIDAELRQEDASWRLEFLRNDKPMLAWHYTERTAAQDEADRRLHELQMAGWTVHW